MPLVNDRERCEPAQPSCLRGFVKATVAVIEGHANKQFLVIWHLERGTDGKDIQRDRVLPKLEFVEDLPAVVMVFDGVAGCGCSACKGKVNGAVRDRHRKIRVVAAKRLAFRRRECLRLHEAVFRSCNGLRPVVVQNLNELGIDPFLFDMRQDLDKASSFDG